MTNHDEIRIRPEYIYCVIEEGGYPGDFDGEAYVTSPEDVIEFIMATSARSAKAEYRRRHSFVSNNLRARRISSDPSLYWHDDYGRYEDVWFAYRVGESGNCAAVDRHPEGWQYLIYDRNGTWWFVRRPAFYPTREKAMAAAVKELEAQP